MKERIIYIYFLLIFIFFSGCGIWSESEDFKVENNPVVCFNEVTPECGGENYRIPMPSSYMEAALPKGLTVNINPATPFIVKFGDEIDKETMTAKNVIVLKDNNVLPAESYSIDYYKDKDDKVDKSILAISSTSGTWESDANYTVILLNGLKSTGGKIFGKSKAWFLAISSFPLIDKNGKSLIENLSDENAKKLQELRNNLLPKLDLLTKLLNINKFNILLLWSFRFEKPIVCFKDDINGCKDNPIPIPSDFMSFAMPENIHLNIPDNSSLSVKFSKEINPETLKDNVIVVRFSQNGISFIPYKELKISFKNEEGIPDLSKLYISLKKGHWDFGGTYLIILKKGIKDYNGEDFKASSTTFFAKMENSLFKDENLTELRDDLIPLFKGREEDALSLEMLRRKYKGMIDESSVKREDIIMFWSLTFKEPYFIPCFNSNNFPGCENSNEVPLPSDFIMYYEYDENGNEVSRHLNLPVDDDSPVKELIEGINTLDGWSTSKPFSITLSKKPDITTLNTDLTDIANNPPALWVLKVTYDENKNIHANPVPVKVNYIDDISTLKIYPILGKWEENTKYLIIMTKKIKGVNEEKFVKPVTFSLMSLKDSLLNEDNTPKYEALNSFDKETLLKLEGARKKFNEVYNALSLPLSEGGLELSRDEISMMWTVTTQTVTLPLKDLIALVKNENSIPKHTLVIDKLINNTEIYNEFANYLNSYWMQGGTTIFTHVSKIAKGKFIVPWFLNDYYVFDRNKIENGVTDNDLIEVPVLIAFPPEGQDVKSNNKIIIFQHGINDSKEEVLPILDTFTQNGYIVVSMDLPLHGERSIDLTDLRDNFSPLRNIPDGIPDNSGKGFLGLNVFATRDLIRQAVIEQTVLASNLTDINFNELDSRIKFSGVDSENINYFGFSLGTIIGNIFVSLDDVVSSAALNAPGGILTNIVMNTKESISKPLFEALKSLGLEKGSKELDDFMYLAQVVLDPADPVNYSRDGLKILIQKVKDDPVMPNKCTDALGMVLGVINPFTGEKNPVYFKEYTMDDYDPSKLFWHSFTMINKSLAVTESAREDLMNFFAGN